MDKFKVIEFSATEKSLGKSHRGTWELVRPNSGLKPSVWIFADASAISNSDASVVILKSATSICSSRKFPRVSLPVKSTI